VKTCYIAAPAGTDLRVLSASLQSRGVRIAIPDDRTGGSELASDSLRLITESDLVIGVVTSPRRSLWVLFELGQAAALGKRIVLFVSPKTGDVPLGLNQYLVLRIGVGNAEGIEFALDQVLSAPEAKKATRAIQTTSTGGIGNAADHLLANLHDALETQNGRLIDELVSSALRLAGADVVVSSPERERGADFAVWSGELDPYVSNPLLIEIKTEIRGRNEAQSAMRQLASYIEASGSRWALLLYGNGPSPDAAMWTSGPKNVLALPLNLLIERLRSRSFSAVVRDLRNRRVHGIHGIGA
jgi:hypothetical protein